MNVRKSITVRRPVDTTFEAFTAGFGRWWPLQAFSYGGDRSKEIHLEGRCSLRTRVGVPAGSLRRGCAGVMP